MKKPPTLVQAMTPFPYHIEPEAPILAARRMMLEHEVRHLPVVHDGELCGIVSDRDIKLILGPEFDYPRPREVTVADARVEEPYTVAIDAELGAVLLHMAEHHIGAALVTRAGKLAGILTASDACRVLGELLSEGGDDPPEAA